MSDEHAVEVVGVRMELPSNSPLVLLREVGGARYLPIWIGAAEASAIAFAQQGAKPPRPLTHDLFCDTLIALGRPVVKVRITSLTDGVFYAFLDFADGTSVSARPSDAIALGLRMSAPMVVGSAVLDEAGMEMPDEEESEVEKFREFLDHINPEDFEDRPSS